jgi:hypothetical protein
MKSSQNYSISSSNGSKYPATSSSNTSNPHKRFTRAHDTKHNSLGYKVSPPLPLLL